jgi:hypothetical protein
VEKTVENSTTIFTPVIKYLADIKDRMFGLCKTLKSDSKKKLKVEKIFEFTRILYGTVLRIVVKTSLFSDSEFQNRTIYSRHYRLVPAPDDYSTFY